MLTTSEKRDMRKPSKTVPREELEALKEQYFRAQGALDAVLNHETEFPVRIKASELGGIKEASKYTFRFIPKTYSTLVIATFSTIGQRDSSTVYDLDQQDEYCRRNPTAIWARIWSAAIHARQMKQSQKAQLTGVTTK